MKPRKNYRTRPKKSGAKKRQRVLAQKKRLKAAGYDDDKLHSMNTAEIRDALKKAARKSQDAGKKKEARKAASKAVSAKKKKTPAGKKRRSPSKVKK